MNSIAPSAPHEASPAERPSVSLLRRRLRKFRALKRGYYSFVIMLIAYGLSFFLPFLVNNRALLVRYQSQYYFPILRYYPAATFGQQSFGEPDYRALARSFHESDAGDWAILPPVPYSPTESLVDPPGSPPHPPSSQHPFATDAR